MRERFAFLFIVLSLSVCVCAQEGTVEHGWTDENNTEMYAAYMLQHAYYEQGYWESKVEIRQAGTKRSSWCSRGGYTTSSVSMFLS